MWEVMLDKLPKGEIVDIHEIYETVERDLELDSEDFEPLSSGRDLRWKSSIRNVLQYRKTTGEIFWFGEGQYMMPVSTDEEAITSSLPVRDGMNEEEFKKLQEQRDCVCLMGERYVVDMERRELIDAGRTDLAKKVKRVSIDDVGLGYDILSYDIDDGEEFIAVKTAIRMNSIFELTANQISTAEEKGDSYWLYFLRNMAAEPEVIKINDPYSEIDNRIKLTPVSYRAVLEE